MKGSEAVRIFPEERKGPKSPNRKELNKNQIKELARDKPVLIHLVRGGNDIVPIVRGTISSKVGLEENDFLLTLQDPSKDSVCVKPRISSSGGNVGLKFFRA